MGEEVASFLRRCCSMRRMTVGCSGMRMVTPRQGCDWAGVRQFSGKRWKSQSARKTQGTGTAVPAAKCLIIRSEEGQLGARKHRFLTAATTAGTKNRRDGVWPSHLLGARKHRFLTAATTEPGRSH